MAITKLTYGNVLEIRDRLLEEEARYLRQRNYIRADDVNGTAFELTFILFANTISKSKNREKNILDDLFDRSLEYFKLNHGGTK